MGIQEETLDKGSNPIASAILLHRRARHWRALSFLGFGKISAQTLVFPEWFQVFRITFPY